MLLYLANNIFSQAKKLLSVIPVIIIFNIVPVFASMETIKTMDQIPMDDCKNTLFVFDWDDTVVKRNTKDLIDEKGISQLTQKINNSDSEEIGHVLILTARGAGKDPIEWSNATGDEAVKPMGINIQKLGLHPTLRKEIFEKDTPLTSGPLENTVIYKKVQGEKDSVQTLHSAHDTISFPHPNIVFAGSGTEEGLKGLESNKAAALEYIIDNELLRFTPQKVIFIDDKDTEVQEMITYFNKNKKSYTVQVYHYKGGKK